MPHTLIIGYGNPLRGDDGIGPRAATLLAEVGPAEGVEVLVRHQLDVELAPLIAETERLILIDACARGEPGTVQVQSLAPELLPPSSLSHYLDARGLLAVAQMLYGHAPDAVLFTVSGGSFAFDEVLSPMVAAALPGLLMRIRERLACKENGRPKPLSPKDVPY